MKSVSIVDYGVGNLLSVARAFEYLNTTVHWATTPEDIEKAERLVLPGVGAFSNGMQGLREAHLENAIKQFARAGKPFLGICLGMQMMLSKSYEFGEHEGLNLIEGYVEPIPTARKNGQSYKVPHIGWNTLQKNTPEQNWTSTILEDLPKNPAVYFVHSYRAKPVHEKEILADCDYFAEPICAVIHRDNLYGCQFHPEKSGEVGLKLIENFMAI